jgi:proteasome lid subunit RPN8/RPN11
MIYLTLKQRQKIYDHGENAYPEECCGILLGFIKDHSKEVVTIIKTANAWSRQVAQEFKEENIEYSKRRRYSIAPQDMLSAQKQARASNLSVIGIFHSHPDYPAEPSEFDRLYAWHSYSYIIISIYNGQSFDCASWILDDSQQLQKEPIEIIN